MYRMQRTCCLITAGGWVRSTRRLTRRRPRDPRASPPPSTHYTTAAHYQRWKAACPQLSPRRHLRLQAGVCDHIMPKSICCRHAVSRVPPVRAHWVVRFSLLFSTLFGFKVGHGSGCLLFPPCKFHKPRKFSATANNHRVRRPLQRDGSPHMLLAHHSRRLVLRAALASPRTRATTSRNTWSQHHWE